MVRAFVAVRFSALVAGAPVARVTTRRASRVAAREVFDSCLDEARAPRELRRAWVMGCERIVAVVAITEGKRGAGWMWISPGPCRSRACHVWRNPRPKSVEAR